MILFELTGSEQNPIYQDMEISNGNRQYDFLKSVVLASIAIQKPFLSSQIIKALNFQAITCLHTNPGEYRPCPVVVGNHQPPEHYRVPPLMDDFVNTINRAWETADPVALAAFVLWRLNHIHPFINGNGRTARAACYFVLLNNFIEKPDLSRVFYVGFYAWNRGCASYCAGLFYLESWQRGRLHRSLKPPRVLVLPSEGSNPSLSAIGFKVGFRLCLPVSLAHRNEQVMSIIENIASTVKENNDNILPAAGIVLLLTHAVESVMQV